MSELAEHVLLSPSGTSRLVDRLEQDGLIERQACESDGRAVHAVVTEKGRRLLEQVQPTYDSVLRQIFLDHLSPGENRLLAQLLLRLAGKWPRRP